MLQEQSRAALTGATGGLLVQSLYLLSGPLWKKFAHPCFKWITSGNHSLNKDKVRLSQMKRRFGWGLLVPSHSTKADQKNTHLNWQLWALKYYSGIQAKSSWDKVPSFLCELTTVYQVTHVPNYSNIFPVQPQIRVGPKHDFRPLKTTLYL